MNAPVEFEAPVSDQRLLRALIRGALKLFFRSLVRPPMPIAGQRAVLKVLTAFSPRPRGVVRAAATLGGRPCEWHQPAHAEGHVLLYLHGGAYVIGRPQTHRAMCAALAAGGRMKVCALDYRRAPEFPYPAARDDAVAAYEGLLNAGYRAEQIVIGGDSAGANLALVTSLALRQRGLAQPAALLCFSPLTDFTFAHWHRPPTGDPMLHPRWVEQAAALYCPPGLPRDDPGLSPVYADLAGLPPLMIQVGEDEILLNDSLRLAKQASAAGVAVTLERYPGLWHVFQANVGRLRAADRALERAGHFCRSQARRRTTF